MKKTVNGPREGIKAKLKPNVLAVAGLGYTNQSPPALVVRRIASRFQNELKVKRRQSKRVRFRLCWSSNRFF